MKFITCLTTLALTITLGGCENASTNTLVSNSPPLSKNGTSLSNTATVTVRQNNQSETNTSSTVSNASSRLPSGSTSNTDPSIISHVYITAKHVKTKTADVTYPQLSGLSNTAVQEKLNEDLVVNPTKLTLMNSSDTFTSDYKLVYQAGNLLEIDSYSYDYPQGAAHGEPGQEIHLMNLRTGQSYTMKDLFLSGSSYLSTLSKLVKEKDTQHILDPDFSGVSASDGFILTATGIQIFFTPYEWAPFAAGFPTFNISFTEIKDVINTQGSLWKSIQSPETQRDLQIQAGDVAKIQSLGFMSPSLSPTDTEMDSSFAASGSHGIGTLYAFSAAKKGSQNGTGNSNVFFFVDEKYLGTDTRNPHTPISTMYPDGPGSITVVYNENGGQYTYTPFPMRFTWNGSKLETNRAFPQSFS